ncbi:hypothetical protein B0H17DRAFT_1304208 [Mycena rosella]|uniref:Uncharacterized protein n=1 Tax=Mycena rosella TaxID=1033263 RepID=A0AAD7DA52_MYCRO|nr:hypothetical protein B0H17DRAFT_1304208 [Mycena rosella]
MVRSIASMDAGVNPNDSEHDGGVNRYDVHGLDVDYEDYEATWVGERAMGDRLHCAGEYQALSISHLLRRADTQICNNRGVVYSSNSSRGMNQAVGHMIHRVVQPIALVLRAVYHSVLPPSLQLPVPVFCFRFGLVLGPNWPTAARIRTQRAARTQRVLIAAAGCFNFAVVRARRTPAQRGRGVEVLVSFVINRAATAMRPALALLLALPLALATAPVTVLAATDTLTAPGSNTPATSASFWARWFAAAPGHSATATRVRRHGPRRRSHP